MTKECRNCKGKGIVLDSEMHKYNCEMCNGTGKTETNFDKMIHTVKYAKETAVIFSEMENTLAQVYGDLEKAERELEAMNLGKAKERIEQAKKAIKKWDPTWRNEYETEQEINGQKGW